MLAVNKIVKNTIKCGNVTGGKKKSKIEMLLRPMCSYGRVWETRV